MLADYKVTKSHLDQTLNKVKQEVIDNPEYIYKPSDKVPKNEELEQIIKNLKKKNEGDNY